jgi:hypothetical protein
MRTKNLLSILIVLFFYNISISQTQVFTFDNLVLPEIGYWNGSDQSVYNQGYFGDENIHFPNTYIQDWQYWENFAFSNWIDNTTQGYDNQWSNFTGGAASGNIFGLAYIPNDWQNSYQTIPIHIDFSQNVNIESIKITNSTYTALTIINGGGASTPFTTDDYYKIIIYGEINGEYTDSLELMLADFINGNNSVIDEWIEIDLSSIGEISSLYFDVRSSDVGDYGINTPTYFCLDDISYSFPINISETSDNFFTVYPNPASNLISLNENYENIEIIDLNGLIVKSVDFQTQNIDISNLISGTYIIRLKNENEIKTSKFIKL